MWHIQCSLQAERFNTIVILDRSIQEPSGAPKSLSIFTSYTLTISAEIVVLLPVFESIGLSEKNIKMQNSCRPIHKFSYRSNNCRLIVVPGQSAN